MLGRGTVRHHLKKKIGDMPIENCKGNKTKLGFVSFLYHFKIFKNGFLNFNRCWNITIIDLLIDNNLTRFFQIQSDVAKCKTISWSVKSKVLQLYSPFISILNVIIKHHNKCLFRWYFNRRKINSLTLNREDSAIHEGWYKTFEVQFKNFH